MSKLRFWRLVFWCYGWKPPQDIHFNVTASPIRRQITITMWSCCQLTPLRMERFRSRSEVNAQLNATAAVLIRRVNKAHGGRDRDHVVDLAGVGGDGA